VEQVHLQRAGDVVGAVPVGRVRAGSDGVLHDPDLVAQDLEVTPAGRMEGCEFRH
jgi:hypothetical protein